MVKCFYQVFVTVILLSFSCSPQPTSNQQSGEALEHLNVPALYARVNDYANILADGEEAELNKLLKSLEDSVGSQLVILSVNSLENSIEEYSVQVANQWGIGRADYNDGIMIILAMSEQEVRIEVGYGLELIVKDEVASRIIDSLMIPEFESGNFAEGLKLASERIIDLIYRNPTLVGKQWKQKEEGQ